MKKDISKSAVAATGFTIEDEYLIQCSQINKRYEENCFLKMFPDARKSFSRLNT